MAKATRVEIPTPVNLELTPDETQFLADLLGCVGGLPQSSRRRYSVSILNALEDVGYKGVQPKDIDKNESRDGFIYFVEKD